MAGSLTYFPATACLLLGIDPPRLAEPSPHPAVAHALQNAQFEAPVERMLVFAPDAIGKKLLGLYPEETEQLRRAAPITAALSSVNPAKTPVCFASMLTGARPAVHGIQRYERPVLECDTLFDALIRAGRRVALVAVRDSSFDVMYQGRELDYFSEEYDDKVTQRTLALLKEGGHDFILAYHQEYDDTLHKTEPFSEECIAAFKRHVATFVDLAQAARHYWAGSSYALAWTPDHGAHVDPGTGHGDHGQNIPDDMELLHFWGIQQAGPDAC